MERQKPREVREAQLAGDTKTLSAFGRAGGLARARNALAEEAFSRIREERRERDEALRQISANEHIIPLDTYN